MNKLHKWAQQKVHSPYALPIFGFLVFIEAVWFMPVNTLLTIYGTEWPKRSFLYALVAWLASIAGAIMGYYIGAFIYDCGAKELLCAVVPEEKIMSLIAKYQHNAWWAVISSSFLPIPFKLITISSGFAKIPVTTYVISVAIGRFFRFFSLGTGLYFFGKQIQTIIDRYFWAFVVGGIAMLGWMLFELYR